MGKGVWDAAAFVRACRTSTRVRHLLSLEFLIPALLGLLTMSGAYLASESLAEGGRASEADREYGLARDQEEIGHARAEGDLQASVIDVAAMTMEAELAMRLEEMAASRPPDDPGRAELLAEVAELRQLSAMRNARTSAAGYVGVDARGKPELDDAALRRGLRRNYEGFFPPRPERFLVVASEARDRSERLAVLILVTAIAGVVGTVAHVARGRRRRAYLGATGFLIWVGTVGAYWTWVV